MHILEEELNPLEYRVKFIGKIENFEIIKKLLEDMGIFSSKEGELIFNLFFRRSKNLIDRSIDIVNILKGRYSFLIYSKNLKIKFIDFYGIEIFHEEDRENKGKIIVEYYKKIVKFSKYEKVL